MNEGTVFSSLFSLGFSLFSLEVGGERGSSEIVPVLADVLKLDALVNYQRNCS